MAERTARSCVPSAALGVLAVLAACAPLVRPEGNGGWSAGRRHEELARRARAADVALAPVGTEDAGSPSVDAALSARPPAAALTLADALAQATRGNRRLAEARRQLAAARAQVAEVRGRLFPATTGSGRYTWYSDPLTNGITLAPGVPATSVPPTITVRDQELGTVSGTMTLPLDLTGELRHALAAAQAGYRGEAARLWAVQLTQEVVVVGAYYTLLEAERLREVTRQTIALQETQLAHARRRFDGGRLTKNQLLVVEVGLRNAEVQLRQRTLAISRARWALNQALGLPIGAPTRVVDVRTRPTLPPLKAALRGAYEDNPVLRALLEEQQRLDATATALARGRFPRLAGGGTIEHSTTDVLDPRTIGAGFVGFEWDLGTDGRREARIAEARIRADRNRLTVERELRELEEAVRGTHEAAAERLAALAAAEAGVGQAEENLRIRQQQFEVGRATSEDVLDAEALLAAQRATLASALYQAQTRRAELQRLMGRPLDVLASPDG